jgi:Sulfatase-modifying factor enzyme 1
MRRVGSPGAISGLLLVTSVAAQQGAPISVLPQYPPAQAFDPRAAPASAAQHASMVTVPAGTYPIGSPEKHPLADRAAVPAHHVTLRAFRIDRTEVTNGQFAEFLNALPLKPSGTAHPGGVGPANISAHRRWLFQSGRRSAPPAIIELDDDNALIGIRDGQFAPGPGREQHPVTETTWAGALAYCRWRGGGLLPKWNGKLPHAAPKGGPSHGARQCPPLNSPSSSAGPGTRYRSAVDRKARRCRDCSTWPAACRSGPALWTARTPTARRWPHCPGPGGLTARHS